MFNARLFSRLFVLLMFVTFLAAACGKEEEKREIPRPPPEPDAGDVYEQPDTPTPPDEDTGPTGPPGFLHGEWEVRKTDAEEEHIYTLHLVHIEGENTVTGDYTFISTGAQGTLSPGSWRNDIFEINWTRMVQGGERVFGIVGAEKQTDDLLLGRHNDRICLCTYDVKLIRKP